MSKQPATHHLEDHTLGDLLTRVWKNNPRRHDLESIAASVGRHGYVETITIDDTSGQVVSGHGVIAVLLIRQEDGLDLPARVYERDGDWAVPVLHVRLPKGEAQAYTLGAVRTRELGTWDTEQLTQVLQDIEANTDLGLEGIGWSKSELAALLAGMSGELPASFTEVPEPGEAEASAKKPVTCPHCGETFTP